MTRKTLIEMVVLLLLPWLLTAFILIVERYGEAIDLFFERLLKTLLL